VAAEEVHHEILCAVIQAEGTDQQALTAATPHNVSLHIVFLRGLYRDVAQEKLNLFQLASRIVTEPSARPPEIVWCEF
jgi:hypothetical protein